MLNIVPFGAAVLEKIF